MNGPNHKNSETGLTNLYWTYEKDNQIWNGVALVDYVVADYFNYCFTAIESPAGSLRYLGDMTGMPVGKWTTRLFQESAPGVRAVSDYMVSDSVFDWNGTREASIVDLAKPGDNMVASNMVPAPNNDGITALGLAVVALGSPLQDDDARLPATIIAAKTDVDAVAGAQLSGLITGIIDLGYNVTTDLLPITMEIGAKNAIQVKILENGAEKNCTGYTAKFGMKENISDAALDLEIDGIFSNSPSGVKCILTIPFVSADTESFDPMFGVYSIAIYDEAGNKTPLNNDPDGLPFELKKGIL